jgi:hypothetical protein
MKPANKDTVTNEVVEQNVRPRKPFFTPSFIKKPKTLRLPTVRPEGGRPLPSIRKKLPQLMMIVLFALGAFGAGLKYLEEDAARQMRNGNRKTENIKTRSLLNRLNPFIPHPPPPPPPQLTREYIYAGERLLAVADADAAAAPPADLAVWRPSTGVWWVMGGNGSQQVSVQWGIQTDRPVPGDYDGDGRTDFSVFRPSEGRWYVQRSSDATLLSYDFGLGSDRMAPADYDGDGRTDPAVFRPSNATWYILRSSDSGITYQTFGLSNDTPAPADYDGDGCADIAVWRSSVKTFYSIDSSGHLLRTKLFPQSGSEPVPADYDGDGRADHAIRSADKWIISYSSTGQTQTISWQQAGDMAVHNDYDGDGRADIAVWRETGGVWFIRKSSNGQLRQETWGQAGDFPVPAYYKR